MRCLVVGIGNVRDGNALAAILGTDPVGVRQVDADGRRRILVTTQHGSTNGIGCHTLYLLLAETRINGRVVLKPLGITADGLRTPGGLQVLIFDDALPRAFQPQRVTIDLDEAVDEVDASLMLTHPRLAVVIETLQVASPIVVNKIVYDLLLVCIFSHATRFL